MKENTHLYGIDILRSLAMFMVVILHILYHGKILKNVTGVISIPYELLESFCFGAVDLFAMISGYLLVFSKWKLSRYFVLYVQVAFYTILFAVVSRYIDGKSLSNKEWQQAIIAVIGNYWYITSYVGVLTLIPILNAFLVSLNFYKNYKTVIFVCLVIIFGSIFLSKSMGYLMGYSCIWLSALYLLGGIVRVNQTGICKVLKTQKRKFWIGISAYMVFSILACIGYFMTINKVGNVFFRSYYSPFVILGTLSLFIALYDLQIRSVIISKCMNFFATSALGVYLITENNWFRAKVITNKFVWIAELNPVMGIAYVIVIGFVFFLLSVLIDAGRHSLFKRLGIYKFVQNIADYFTGIYNHCTEKILLKLKTE